MFEKKQEQMERYKLHWDGVQFNEASFEFNMFLLNKIKENYLKTIELRN